MALRVAAFLQHPELQTLFAIAVAAQDKSDSLSREVRPIAAILLSGSSWWHRARSLVHPKRMRQVSSYFAVGSAGI